ncbi:MAG TPA: AsmA-like C-terminal region-containing protein, partial [Gemmatimonadaceae bacterium]|nr:AsmA-like C-terminal region-containing protein [Gemmatimonadaceae bacterium]
DANVDADLPAHRFQLSGVTLRLNQLALALDGTVTTAAPHPALDLTFSSPSTAFGDILSLVPALHRREVERLRTSGRMSVSGRVRGVVKPDTFPAFAVRARVENGSFQDPSLPLPAREIDLQLALDNAGGPADATVLTVDRLRATIGGRRLDGRLVLRTPVSDPDVDLRLVGSLDLGALARTVRLGGVQSLAGLVAADVALRARVSDVDARRYERVDARGAVYGSRVVARASALPQALAVDTLALRLTPRAAELGTLALRLGASDLTATGSIDNLLGFALRGDELRGRATVRSRRFDLKALIPEKRSEGVVPVPARVDFAIEAAADRVDYGAIAATNVRGDLRVRDRRVTLDSIRMEMLRGTVIANGHYETRDASRPTFDATLRLAAVDVPSAFAAMQTVQRLAPIARRATGTVGGSFTIAGAMDSAMVPVFAELDGRGALDAAQLGLQGSRVFERLAETLAIEQLRNPSLGALRLAYSVTDGRVTVQPFTVSVAGIQLVVGGSHGVDGTLGYDLQLAVPRALLDGATRGAVTRLAARAGKAGVDLGTGEGVRLAARVTGTATNPTVAMSFAGIATSLREAAREAVRQQVETRVSAVRERADSAAEAGRRRAREEAERVLAAASAESAEIRARARALADSLRRRAAERADSLANRATNPIARQAAQLAATRAKREADAQAERLLRAAEARADSVMVRARQRADSLAGGTTAGATGAARPL